MTIHKFISGLNWRQILIHFVAAWFFMYSFQTLTFLHNTQLLHIVRQLGNENIIKALEKSKASPSDIWRFSLWPAFANTIGLLTAFIISLTISLKKRWFWANSVFVLITIYLPGWFDLLGWTVLRNIFLTPGQVFKNTTLEFLSNGIILLMPGLLAFFSRRSNEFINRQSLLVTQDH